MYHWHVSLLLTSTIFVATKHISHDTEKHFVATNIILSRQNISFVVTDGAWSVRMFVRPNILRTLRRTMIRFLIEHLVRQIWFGQSRLYFILNWLVMRCKLRPNLRQTRSRQHDRKCRLKSSQVKSSQYTLIIPHRVTQLTTISFWYGSPRQGCAFHKSTHKQIPFEASEEPSDTVIHFYFSFFSPFTGELCSQPVRGNDRPIGRMFPEHVERRFLDPEYSLDEYFQLGSWRKVGPIKNQLASPNTSN